MKNKLSLVIVGHIDHGKSTLIGRLLYDTESLPEGTIEEIEKTATMLGKKVEFAHILDHLEEEREKGITIDTAQTFFKTKKREYVVIDAPGHKEFLKNMITGASQAEAAILIVDLKEGVMEQTKRHAYILTLLGIKQLIVAMNKMDLVNYSEERFEEVKKDILQFLSSIRIAPSYIIPVSAFLGENVVKKSKKISFYKGPTILEALDSFKKKKQPEKKPLILPIQDVYNINGEKIAVGRIETGIIKSAKKVVVLPQNKELIIRKIEKFGEKIISASAGENIGLSADFYFKRGDILVENNDRMPRVVKRFKANIFWLSQTPLKRGETVTMQIATQEISCKITKIEKRIDSSSLEIIGEDSDIVKDTEVGEVLIETEQPIVVENFNDTPELGRFVIIKNEDISGGGIIV